VSFAFADGRDQEFLVTDAGLTLGRSPTSDIVLADPTVSRNHARIERAPDGYVLVDLASTRGSRINGTSIQRAALKSGDAISLGDVTFIFRMVVQESPRPSQDAYADAGVTALEEAPVVPEGPTIACVVIRTAQRTWEVPLGREPVTIGRIPENAIFLDEPGVSRRHARIEREGDSFVIHDLHSTNGTWIGLRRIDEHALDDGDTVRIGTTRLAFKRNLTPAELSAFEAGRQASVPAVLEIEIDSAKCQKQVEEITDSDFFRELREKARRMRTR
jgi:pSer/pThr/pTyr-binding forkhead associated (FHA) protein